MLSVATMYSIADAIDLQADLLPVIELLNDACAFTVTSCSATWTSCLANLCSS